MRSQVQRRACSGTVSKRFRSLVAEQGRRQGLFKKHLAACEKCGAEDPSLCEMGEELLGAVLAVQTAGLRN